MKLNFHRSKLYVYVNFMGSKNKKIIGLFEDYDETFINYNYNSTKKEIKFDLENQTNFENDKNLLEKKNINHKNFYDEFFLNIKN